MRACFESGLGLGLAGVIAARQWYLDGYMQAKTLTELVETIMGDRHFIVSSVSDFVSLGLRAPCRRVCSGRIVR